MTTNDETTPLTQKEENREQETVSISVTPSLNKTESDLPQNKQYGVLTY